MLWEHLQAIEETTFTRTNIRRRGADMVLIASSRVSIHAYACFMPFFLSERTRCQFTGPVAANISLHFFFQNIELELKFVAAIGTSMCSWPFRFLITAMMMTHMWCPALRFFSQKQSCDEKQQSPWETLARAAWQTNRFIGGRPVIRGLLKDKNFGIPDSEVHQQPRKPHFDQNGVVLMRKITYSTNSANSTKLN